MLKNKKAEAGNVLLGQVIFIILDVVVFSMLIFFVFSQTSGQGVLQEEAAKKIALAVDSMEPGTILTFSLEKEFEMAEKKGIENFFSQNSDTNTITINLGSSNGYSYRYFSEFDELIFSLNEGDKTIIIETR
jgi:heme/copper-type cytochrome/quinol oxidase subunit 3